MVLTASNGQNGIELAKAENPDMILLDIMMPGMDGFEVCQRLKENEQLQDIPVIFLTGQLNSKESRIKALEIGAEGFLFKPIDEIELIAQVRAMVKIKAANEQKRNERLYLKRLVDERTTELKKSHEMLLKLTDQVPGVVFQYRMYSNGRSCFPYSSSGIKEICYVTPEEIKEDATPAFNRVHPEDYDNFITSIMDSARTLELYHNEFRVVLPGIGVRWRMCDAKPERMDDGSTLWYGIITDCTARRNAEESLSHSNELNQSLLQTIPFGMDIVDEYGNILFISENLSKHFGKNALGQKCWHLYRDDHKQCPNCPLISGIQFGITNLYESKGVLGGKTFQISHTGMMFKGKMAMLEIFQDISEKKEIENKLKLMAYSLESISECVSITDNEDKIVYVNKSFLHTYGYKQNELIGQHIAMLRPENIAYEHIRNILPETLEGGWRGEIMNKKKDGTQFPILLSTSVIKDDLNNPVALIGVAMDITEMLKHRAELINAKEKAEESNHLKSAFLNNMSHEIRTPMNHIMGFSSLMAESNNDDKDEYAAIILNSSNQLLTMIENVILLSRLQSEKPEVNQQPLEPADLITNLGAKIKAECQKKNINLILKIPIDIPRLSILSDHEKIKQILINLTSNAIKYTAEGFVEVGYEVKLDQLIFYVKDSGMGIPPQEHDKIFESFYRTDTVTSKAIGGTGLGLSIVKELVRSMSGTLWLESEAGKGSCFYFSIPMVRSKEALEIEKSSHSSHHKLKDLSILIADDEQINFLYLDVLLKNSVKRIDHAYNGKDALEMASKHPYDVIFMDLNMPEMSGYDATMKIKQSYPAIPIIAQTAYASIEDREKALQAGCDDFIAKPIKKNALLEIIKKYC
ncbi:MAG: response regulator [Bacteroidia bacterium]|nr:response regulator [Bacteroidia bacterium]